MSGYRFHDYSVDSNHLNVHIPPCGYVFVLKVNEPVLKISKEAITLWIRDSVPSSGAVHSTKGLLSSQKPKLHQLYK